VAGPQTELSGCVSALERSLPGFADGRYPKKLHKEETNTENGVRWLVGKKKGASTTRGGGRVGWFFVWVVAERKNPGPGPKFSGGS